MSKIKQTTGDNNAQNSQTNNQNFPSPHSHSHPHQPSMAAAAGEPVHQVTLPEEGDPVGMQEDGLNVGSLIMVLLVSLVD